MDNARGRRFFATKMIEFGFTVKDGSKYGTPLTMQIFDSWDEQFQRTLACEFLCRCWESLTPAQQAAQVSTYPQVCHRCGAHGGAVEALAPDAAVGYTKLYCSGCALRSLLGGPPPPVYTPTNL